MGKRFYKRYKKLEDKSIDESNSNANKTNQDNKPTGFLDLANNLTRALVDWQRAGRPVVTSEQWNHRLSICRGCEYWREFKETKIAKCTKCGCSSGKLLLATSKCPLSPPKWSSV
tara:strand:- start:562 stop:906 length:345 start_codon:yes stop_codon:yes gene_type:complete